MAVRRLEMSGESAPARHDLQPRSAGCTIQRCITSGHERRETVTYMVPLAFFIPYRCNDCLRKDHLSGLVIGDLETNTGVIKMKQGILGKNLQPLFGFHFLEWESTGCHSPF